MPQQYPVLEVDGDLPGSASGPAIFEMPDVTVTPISLTEYLAQFGGGGGVAGALTQGEQIALDVGGGPKNFEIEFNGWTGSDDYQWGTSASPTTVSKSTATGADRMTQVSVLVETLDQVNIGSNNPATLYYGEWSTSTSFADSGQYKPVEVAIPEVRVPLPHNDESSTFRGQLTCISTESLGDIKDRIQSLY